MMRTIDLRGEAPVDYQDVLPRPEFDVEAAQEVVHPDL